MLTYELSLLLKFMPKPEMATVLKRMATSIFDKGGVIRKLDNLGARKLPFKTSKHGFVHREAHYFIISFVAPPTQILNIDKECERDVDLIRSRIYKSVEPEEFECTLEEELRPAPYRSEVQQMIEEGKIKEAKKPKFRYNTGLDYYPFQK